MYARLGRRPQMRGMQTTPPTKADSKRRMNLRTVRYGTVRYGTRTLRSDKKPTSSLDRFMLSDGLSLETVVAGREACVHSSDRARMRVGGGGVWDRRERITGALSTSNFQLKQFPSACPSFQFCHDGTPPNTQPYHMHLLPRLRAASSAYGCCSSATKKTDQRTHRKRPGQCTRGYSQLGPGWALT